MHCVHVIHSLEPGGAERVLVDLAEVAVARGVRITVVPLLAPRDPRIADALRAASADVRPLHLAGRWDPRAFARCRRLLRALRPDVVHSHLKHADLTAAVSSRGLSIPLVSTLHVIEDTPAGLDRLKRGLAVAARSRVAARTITVSEAQRRWYTGTFRVDPARVVTIPNGVRAPAPATETDRARVRRALGAPDTAVVAVMVAIMRPGKGHADLLAALAHLPAALDVRVVLAGDGELRHGLEAAAATLPPGRVSFAGFVDDVTDLLRGGDLVVQPSHADALPTALIQALAAGLPVVATTVGGIPEIVTPDVGVLVPPGDVPALAAALASVAEDAGLRSSCAKLARRRFEEHFEASIWLDRLLAVYREVGG